MNVDCGIFLSIYQRNIPTLQCSNPYEIWLKVNMHRNSILKHEVWDKLKIKLI